MLNIDDNHFCILNQDHFDLLFHLIMKTHLLIFYFLLFPFTSFFTSIDKKQKPSRQANDEQKIIPIEYTGVSERKERKI